jgi:hypothetical protein
VVLSVTLPLPLEEPGEQENHGPKLATSATVQTVQIRRRLPADAGERRWLLQFDVEVSVPDPEELLAHSEGFLVDGTDGRQIGVVESVGTGDDGHVSAIVVARGWFGRRRAHIPVEAIDAILPAQRRIVLR